MLRISFIAMGGAIGTMIRYIIAGLDFKCPHAAFPIGTLVINLAGSFTIGFLWGLFEKVPISPTLRMFVFIGILGGFTTFSTFSLENFHLIRDGEYKIAFVNIIASNVVGIALVFAGFLLARSLVSIIK